MANVKTSIFDLNNYEPILKTIERPTTNEYVNSPEMTELANLGIQVNRKMLQIFERDPENEDMKRIVLFASITQGISAVNGTTISPFSDIGGDEETYCKYLEMLANAAEIIFGSESEFAKAINSVIYTEPRSSLSVLVALNTEIDKMYDKILREGEEPFIPKNNCFSEITVIYDGHQAIVGESDFSEKYSVMLKKATDDAKANHSGPSDVHFKYLLDECPGGFGASLSTAGDALSALQNAISAAEYAYTEGYERVCVKTGLTIKLNPVKYE